MREIATLAGGCFWCLEAVYDRMKGVESVESGYIGGKAPNPSYQAVCTSHTGHAEAVQITFDSKVVSYRELLEVFFVIHDPTTLNRQGHDVGTQYRSAIFPTTAEQARVATAYIDQLKQDAVFGAPIVTSVEPDKTFYPAEAYHQDYLTRNPRDLYIVVNDLPKIEALKRLQPDVFRANPVLVGTARSG